MSQKSVEGLLGRMVTDQRFRWRFYKDPVAACLAEAMEVTTRELEAVLTLDETQVAAFARQLDSRIVRAVISGEACSSRAAADAGSETGTRTKQHRVPLIASFRVHRRPALEMREEKVSSRS